MKNIEYASLLSSSFDIWEHIGKRAAISRYQISTRAFGLVFQRQETLFGDRSIEKNPVNGGGSSALHGTWWRLCSVEEAYWG